MQYHNNLDAESRLKAIEVTLAYTITAISQNTPSVKNQVLESLKFDSNNENNSQNIKDAFSAIAALIEAFEVIQR
ncbi:hypothetical protein AB7092_08105 [Providencia rettgeri]|uniref:hypothetical protein n=1 Tax=unclassified Providencia TaxID=2633465 RepID=UPI00234A10C9|nr:MULTISPECIES: hypothetical protein [unclassified Providencia]